MDLWVVAVAAGVVCLAKCQQNLSIDGNSLPELSSGDSNAGKSKPPGHPCHRFAWRKKLGDDVSTDRRWVSDGRTSDIYRTDCASAAEVTSTSRFDVENLGCSITCENPIVLSVSSLPQGCSTNIDIVAHDTGSRLSADRSGHSGNSVPGPSSGIASFHRCWRNRSTLRTKRSYGPFIKPLSAVESCLLAQLYKEHAEMEDYVLCSPPSPSRPAMRPLFFTDGNQILSRTNGHLVSEQILLEEDRVHKEPCLNKNEKVCGIPPLLEIGSLEFPNKVKETGKVGNGRPSRSIKMVSGKHVHSQDGLPDGQILFCLGISIGIISSFIVNKKEVEKLQELLKQTQNFVQDLQEELEMKDSVTVKELANEHYKSQDACDNSYDRALTSFSAELHVDSSAKCNGLKSSYQKAEERSEPLSQIEAELEAELERLELNMSSSSLDRRLSDLVELDPDFVADFAQGELRADMIHDQAVAQPKSNRDARDDTTPDSGNYAVSPRELSFRLHEIIQSRLEERVQELETALENSQKKLNLMESGRRSSWKKFSSCERECSSTPENSVAKECNPMAQPLVMHLSGEALDANDDDAYIELIKIDDSEGHDLSFGLHENMHPEGFNLSDQPTHTHQNSGIGRSITHLAIDNDFSSMEFFSSKMRRFGGDPIEVQVLDDVISASEDESSDFDDEIEQQLIKQIVEKSKKGSPVVLNAQKVLLSLDEK